MDDLISRRAALDMCRKPRMRNADCSDFELEIMMLPSAQPERKKGKWIHVGGDEWACDKCGFILATEGSWEHPLDAGNYYCKHCGTDMREEKTDG